MKNLALPKKSIEKVSFSQNTIEKTVVSSGFRVQKSLNDRYFEQFSRQL